MNNEKIIKNENDAGIKLPICPLCQTKSNEVLKEWDYSAHHVKSFNCGKCKKPFQAYYFQDRLSYTLSNFTPKARPTKRNLTLSARIIQYLKNHDPSGEKEMAESLGIIEEDILKELIKLEKKGFITSFKPSEVSK